MCRPRPQPMSARRPPPAPTAAPQATAPAPPAAPRGCRAATTAPAERPATASVAARATPDKTAVAHPRRAADALDQQVADKMRDRPLPSRGRKENGASRPSMPAATSRRCGSRTARPNERAKAATALHLPASMPTGSIRPTTPLPEFKAGVRSGRARRSRAQVHRDGRSPMRATPPTAACTIRRISADIYLRAEPARAGRRADQDRRRQERRRRARQLQPAAARLQGAQGEARRGARQDRRRRSGRASPAERCSRSSRTRRAKSP